VLGAMCVQVVGTIRISSDHFHNRLLCPKGLWVLCLLLSAALPDLVDSKGFLKPGRAREGPRQTCSTHFGVVFMEVSL
jgi:hypothetical protein